jgi:hypothetical protein
MNPSRDMVAPKITFAMFVLSLSVEILEICKTPDILSPVLSP